MMGYTFDEHKHRYVVWTAARAVQRNFTTTNNIGRAIDESGLRLFAEDKLSYDQAGFDSFHRRCGVQIMDALKRQGVEQASYGRAAKIIAIYLKTSVVLSNKGTCCKSMVIHPPIDRILLQALAKNKALRTLSAINWTGLEEKPYWELVEMLRKHIPEFNWKLEEHWYLG